MITITLQRPEQATDFQANPMAITIPRGELNENLQHVAQSCQVTVAYEPEILEILALRSFVKATVEDETGTLFTGIIDTGATWTDNGFPTPIDSLQLKINDNTYLLDKQTDDEVALINTTLKDVIEKICSDCNITISPDAKLPVTQLKAFIMDTGTSYLQALNKLLFQHELAFIFTGVGELRLIDFSTPPEDLPVIGQDKILTGFSPTRTAKKYGAVKIGYTLLTKKKDQQVYFEGNDLGEDNKVVPITVRPGQYYPYESDPTQEAREGQVYQEFAEGYAESYQAYNGETKYRRSQKTSLLYTENQRLVQDWEGVIVVDRTDFQARRASVRLYNNGTKDANLLQLAIRADAWYREPTSYVTAGSGNEYLYEGEYLYTPEAAEKLSKTLSRFFLGGNFKLSGRLTEPLGIGQFVHIDTGLSGFQADALCLSCSFEPESEIYSVQFITYGNIAIDIQRYKNYVGHGDPNAKALSDIMKELQSIVDGDYTGIPPTAPSNVLAVATRDSIQISFTHSGVGLGNTIAFYVVAINKGDGQWKTNYTDTNTFEYQFDRNADGYPEKSNLKNWKVKIKAVNIYGEDSSDSAEVDINLDDYLTWQVTAPQVSATAEKDWIDFTWQNVNRDVYGDISYDILQGDRLLGTTQDISYRYWFDRDVDGYPEKADILALDLKIIAKNQVHTDERALEEDDYNLNKYLTWISPQVDISAVLAVEAGIDINWQCNPELTYGDMRYGYTILYKAQEIATKKGIIAYTDTYNFDRDTDGYPEKAGIIASLQAMGIAPKGRDLDKYSVEVFAYTLQKEDQKTTDTADVSGIYYGTWVPAAVQQVKATAYQDRIEVEASAPSTPNDYGTPYRFIFERQKGASDWERFELDGPSITFNFDRQVDGYPEVDELATWRFRAKAVSTAGKENINWGGGSDGVALNLDHYGTWRVGNPQVNASTADRTIRLVMSQPPRADNRQPYGTIQYKIQINRPLTDPLNTWFKPSLSLNPYTSEENYKDGEGYYVASSVYLQTMPLLGQGSSQIENTVYMFRVAAFNEASESEWVEVVATAEASSIKDIVKAKETVKEAYISDLSALSANLGNISQGSLSGNDNNKWDLSTFVDDLGRNHYEGEFRVGGDKQCIHVQPILDSHNMPTGEYNITFKVGAFELSATANIINGELVVMTNAQALDRTRITPTGTYFEHRETSSSDNWTVISQLRTDGLSTESVYSTQSLVITNHDLQTRRKKKIDIGRPYLSDSSRVWHFDTDLLDQYQGQGLEVLGNVDLVDQYNATDTSLDFTPAILAVAPYAEIGRSAYGQFNAQIGIGSPSVFTVDFWIQYIWAENQVIFDVGNTTDKVRLVVQNDEVYFNDYDPEVDAVPFNQEILAEGDVFVFNEPAAASSTIQHYGQGVTNPPAGHVFTLDGHGIAFKKNTWLHIGIILTADNMDVYLDTKKVEFPRYSKGTSTTEVILNGTQNTFVLDELMIDTTTAELFEDFAENTVKRIPWAALDRKNKQFVLEVDNLITNIFDSGSPFETRVKEIITQMKENGEL